MNADYEKIIAAVRASRKYRDLALPDEMLQDILREESARFRDKSGLEKAFRQKLHNIIAPYLEKIDYPSETEKVTRLYRDMPDQNAVRTWARELMARHASTRERLPYLEEFTSLLNEHLLGVQKIFDMACALDPLLLPWLNLPVGVSFLAFDIIKPRIDFLNHWFSLAFPRAQARQQDILANTPTEHADCAFFFKEAHRFEKRLPGSNRGFFERLNVRQIIVSLPANDLSGHHSLVNYHSKLIKQAVEGHAWQMTRALVGNELVFLIDKAPGD